MPSHACALAIFLRCSSSCTVGTHTTQEYQAKSETVTAIGAGPARKHQRQSPRSRCRKRVAALRACAREAVLQQHSARGLTAAARMCKSRHNSLRTTRRRRVRASLSPSTEVHDSAVYGALMWMVSSTTIVCPLHWHGYLTGTNKTTAWSHPIHHTSGAYTGHPTTTTIPFV